MGLEACAGRAQEHRAKIDSNEPRDETRCSELGAADVIDSTRGRTQPRCMRGLALSIWLVLSCAGTDAARSADAGDSGAPGPSRNEYAGGTPPDAATAWTPVRDAVL